VLTLPTAHSRLILLGIEIARLGAERHKFQWVKLFAEPLISLLQVRNLLLVHNPARHACSLD
jgi:uncharacterized small protein (DUF1192 family)